MLNGINFITDEKGNEKAILLDLIAFKKNSTTATEVLGALSDLQQLIDSAGVDVKPTNSWEQAREKLKNLK